MTPEQGCKLKNIWTYTLHKRTTTISILFLTIIVFLAVVIPYVSPYSDDLNGAVHLEINNQAPSFSHIFGTDSAGRDMFTLTIRGGLVSLRVAIGVVLMSVVLGVPLGLIAGVSRKWVDETIMRTSDAFLAFPPFVLPIVIAIALGGSLNNVMFGIAISWFPWYVRIARAQAIMIRSSDYVLISKSMGASTFYIIKKHILPEVKDCADDYGQTHPSVTGKPIPINGVVGDQQSATIGQCCFEPGSLKSTYGTGAFVLLNTGSKKIYSKNRLLTTIAYRINGKTTYAMEGSIFIAGAGVQWLRDKMKLIKKAPETEKIARSSNINDGIYIVPAFSGMGAPYWRPDARGLITGLTRDSNWQSLVRATVESVAYQSYDLFNAMNKDGLKPRIVKIDGGMVANNWFSQFLSDTINLKVIRPKAVSYTHLTLPTKA